MKFSIINDSEEILIIKKVKFYYMNITIYNVTYIFIQTVFKKYLIILKVTIKLNLV